MRVTLILVTFTGYGTPVPVEITWFTLGLLDEDAEKAAQYTLPVYLVRESKVTLSTAETEVVD